jgi:class 3 adenylate cyclase
VAARLEGQAPAGRVVIGERTREAVPALSTEPLEALSVKGRSETVDAYLVDDPVVAGRD